MGRSQHPMKFFEFFEVPRTRIVHFYKKKTQNRLKMSHNWPFGDLLQHFHCFQSIFLLLPTKIHSILTKKRLSDHNAHQNEISWIVSWGRCGKVTRFGGRMRLGSRKCRETEADCTMRLRKAARWAKNSLICEKRKNDAGNGPNRKKNANKRAENSKNWTKHCQMVPKTPEWTENSGKRCQDHWKGKNSWKLHLDELKTAKKTD